MNRLLLFILLILLMPFWLFTRDNAKTLKALNSCANFANESIHGLLIVHRLLELYNQDINKYVDLEGYALNFYSNADLPKNIFEDPEQWFYEVSPNKWYQILQTEILEIDLPQEERLLELSRQMNNICTALNALRFDVEDYIDAQDLTDPLKLQGVYDRLESAVRMYDGFFERLAEYEIIIRQVYEEMNSSEDRDVQNNLLIARMNKFHYSFKAILRALRFKEEKEFSSLISNARADFESLFSELENLTSTSFRVGVAKERMIDKIEKALKAAEKFYETAEVPKEYKLYGKFYFYHNSDLINKMNRYGNGFTYEMNTILEELDIAVPLLIEEPHFYQVIYAEKITADKPLESSDDNIEVLPTRLKEREIVHSSRTIRVDSSNFEVELYDHMIQDGDRISINFNGDWIIEDYSLETKPMKLRLKLNKAGKNYLLLHAETIGRRPPNTMAVSYYYKGEKKEIILKSDLNASELILLEY